MKNKLVKVYNGFDFNSILDKSRKDEKKFEKCDLLFCGRLDENKNPLKLLDIILLVKKSIPNIKIGFLGQGALKEKLETKTDELDLNKNVVIYGFQQNPYIIMKNSKIMCLSSFSEGFPTVIVEGMVLGKPFVSTPVAGTSELSCNEKCGFVTDDNEKYANIIVELLTNKEMYNDMSKNCLSECKKYTIENQVKELEKILEEI